MTDFLDFYIGTDPLARVQRGGQRRRESAADCCCWTCSAETRRRAPDVPHIFTIGGYSQSTYGLLVALAFVVALSAVGPLAGEAGLNQEDVINLGMYCALAGIVGAKLMMFTAHR